MHETALVFIASNSSHEEIESAGRNKECQHKEGQKEGQQQPVSQFPMTRQDPLSNRKRFTD